MLTKIIIAPILILLIHFLQKRFGSIVSGIVPGLPITSGPISYFLVQDQGREYAAASAVASIYGMAAIAVFCFLYIFFMRLRSWQTICLALLGWGTFILGMSYMPARLDVALGFTYLLLFPLAFLMSKYEPQKDLTSFKYAWKLPLKIILVTSLIIAMTHLSTLVSSKWVGLLGSFPIILAVLGTVAHACGEKHAAFGSLKGGIIGLLSSGIFFVIVNLLLETELQAALIYTSAAAASMLFAALLVYGFHRREKAIAALH